MSIDATKVSLATSIRDASAEVRKRPFLVSRHILCDLLAAYDLLAIVISGLLARYIYLSSYRGEETLILEYASLILATSIFFQLLARQRGLYDTAKIEDFLSQIYAMIYVCAATFALTFVMLFFMKASDFYSRVWFVHWAVLFLIFASVGRGIFAGQARRLARRGTLQRPIALIGEGPQFAKVREFLLNDKEHFRLANVLELPEAGSAQVREYLQSFVEGLRTNDVAEVLIALPASRAALMDSIVRQMQTLAADIHILPDLGNTKIPLMRLHRAGDLTFITTVSRPIEGWGVFQKRVEDFAVALIGLALAGPAMLLIALAIKLDSKGPVIFRQRRHGYNHCVIEVLKFRTMTVLEDGDRVAQAQKGDKRVTRVGRFLRRTSLDELPQLINVLRGDMSIVGPRPHALAHNSYYEDLVENYANRHRVKPGMTGWAQIHGFRGEIEHPQKMAERVRYDLEYIENWSISLDLKIIIMTPLFGFFHKNAY
jgi:putative colanic acid biosynthesis UDP-glucose lipid carrier transferase